MRSKLFAVFMILLLTAIFIPSAKAAQVTNLKDTMSRLEKSQASNHTIRFSPGKAISAGQTITLTFPDGFNIGSVDYTDIDLYYCEPGDCFSKILGATPSGATWGASFSGQTLTIESGTDTIPFTTTYVEIEIGTHATDQTTGDQQITNHATADTYKITIGGTFGNSGQLAVVIVADDQVEVSTTVDPTLTFTITNNSVTLLTAVAGNPDASNTAYNGSNTLAAGTNATGGYAITYNGATLTSGANTIDAMATKTTSSNGTEQFGINLRDNATPNVGAEPSGGSGAPASDYNTADQYRFITATTTNLASASGPSADTTYTVSYIANIASNTQAGAYSTTITYICTGTF